MIGAIRIPGLRKPLLDIRLGFALMRDRRVPLRPKLLAILIGIGVTGLVELLELPLESVLSVILPILGAAGDVVADGAEMIAGPLLLGGALLPYLAPREVVEEIRAERSAAANGGVKKPVIDI